MLFQSLHILTKTLTITPTNCKLNEHFLNFTTLSKDSFQTFCEISKKIGIPIIHKINLQNVEKYNKSDKHPQLVKPDLCEIG